MKNTREKNWFFASIKEEIYEKIQENNSVLGECALANNTRILYLSIVAIPLRIIILSAFNGSYDTLILKRWSQGVIASHLILLLFLIGFFIITYRLKDRREASRTMFVLQYIVVIAIMASGISIVTFDQLITTSITPFILSCIISGLVILMRPLVSFIIYIITYLTYYHIIGLTIANQQILLSNRVNGITAVGVGFLISIILWNYNYVNISQKRYIESQQKQLEQMAYYDPLTDLPNRRLFDKLVKREFSSMKRYGHESVIILLDIDDFKSINDTYGHPVGDHILKQISGILQDNVRESDTISRFGGEEFIILMPNTSLEGGYYFAERLRKLIMEKKFTTDSIPVQITASFGISLLCHTENQDFEDCYFHADKALYLAKKRGKNRVEVLNSSAS